jgi:predicted nucleic acid-binding protein
MSFMGDKFFVDTNVLVYAYDDSAGAKHKKALGLMELWESGRPVVSTQVLQELAICFRRRVARPLNTLEIRKIISELLQEWEIFVNTGESVLRAVVIEDRYKISFWDALILHAAQQSAAQILYTGDLSHGQIYGSVRVVNPFHSSQ